MKKLFASVSTLLLLFFLLVNISPAYAADIRSNKDIIIPANAENLEDLYLFGGTIKIDAPVINDLVTAGGDIDINNDVTGNVLATGGNLNLRGNIGNNVRIAGGNILIDGKIERDLVVTGGSVTVSRNASIGGDILFAGGNLDLQGPVQGKMLIGGGHILLNSTVGGNVEGHVGKLVLGPKAIIDGNLSYHSEEKATLEGGAVVAGKQTFTQEKDDDNQSGAQFLTAGSIYKLIVDIILSVLFIFFFGKFIRTLITRMTSSPVQNGAIGFTYVILTPIVSFFSLILLWLGLAIFLFYGLTLFLSVFLTKVFIGWFLMNWWEKRKNGTYLLNWKAGVIGPIVLFILMLIPIIGWIVVAVICLIALGSLTRELVGIFAKQKLEPITVTPKTKPETNPAPKLIAKTAPKRVVKKKK